MRRNLGKFFLTLGVFSVSLHASTLGLKNFRELPAALAEVTGIPTTDPAIAPVLKKVNSQLPLKGLVEEMSSPFMLAATELAGTFCAEMVKVESVKSQAVRRVFKDIDFKIGLKQFTPQLKQAVLLEIADVFWGRAPTTDEVTSLMKSFEEATTSVSATLTTETVNIAKILCAILGTSLEFLVD